MKSIINYFKGIILRLKAGGDESQPTPAVQQPGAMISKLLRMLEDTDEVELSCDEVFDLLDQYVELERRGEDVAGLLPLVKRHLEKCQDCREEYEALVRILGSSSEIGS